MILISGSKSESEEAAAAEDIANSLYDQENFSLQVPVPVRDSSVEAHEWQTHGLIWMRSAAESFSDQTEPVSSVGINKI